MGKVRVFLYIILIIVSLLCSYFLRDYVFLFGTQKLTLKPVFILTSICAVIIIVYIILMIIFKKFNPSLYKRLYNVLFESEDSEFDGDKYINDLRDKIVSFKFLGEEVIKKTKIY